MNLYHPLYFENERMSYLLLLFISQLSHRIPLRKNYTVNPFYLVGVLNGFARETTVTFAENFAWT